MIITTVMVVMLLLWCTITGLFQDRHSLAPNPLHPGVIPLNKESLGWLNGTWFQPSDVDHRFRGVGHSVLAMSGEELLPR